MQYKSFSQCLRIFIVMFLCCVSLFNKAYGQCKLDYSNYHVVFEDDFNTYTDISQLSVKWQFHPGQRYWGWGGDSSEYYDSSQLSLLTGGYLRLSSKLLDTPRTYTYDNAQTRVVKFVSGMIQTRNDIIYDGTTTGGFTHGMFEIRCKMPSNCSFSAFWLFGSPTEIDIFENGSNRRDFTNSVIEWDHMENGVAIPKTTCSNKFSKPDYEDLHQQYHTYTCVWTPTEVAFFFDGRLLKTVTQAQVKTHNTKAAITANLAMREWCYENIYMDIDYIKVLKPDNNDYTLSYTIPETWVNHIITPFTGSVYPSSTQGAIASNMQNENEVFFLNEANSQLYSSLKNITNNTWTTSRLSATAYSSMGDLVYNSTYNHIVYKSSNNRLQYFRKSGGSYVHEDIDNGTLTTTQVSATEGSIGVLPDGNIAFRGTDNKMHLYKWTGADGAPWVHSPISYTYSTGDLIKGDVVCGSDKKIYYKGADDRLQLFSLNAFGIYSHSWIDPTTAATTQKVSAKAGSICITSDRGVIYIGADNKIHRYFLQNGIWQHELVLNYTYSPSEYASGNITWDQTNKRILYIGVDGRVQYFALNDSYHGWIDDYFNTDNYTSFWNSSESASLSLSNSGNTIFYVNQDMEVAQFRWENTCQRVNPPCDSEFEVGKKANPAGINQTVKDKGFIVYPNPSAGTFQVRQDQVSAGAVLSVYNMQGVNIYTELLNGENQLIDITHAPNGVYLIRIESPGRNIAPRIYIKQ